MVTNPLLNTNKPFNITFNKRKSQHEHNNKRFRYVSKATCSMESSVGFFIRRFVNHHLTSLCYSVEWKRFECETMRSSKRNIFKQSHTLYYYVCSYASTISKRCLSLLCVKIMIGCFWLIAQGGRIYFRGK